jgi:DNA ligase-1
VKQFIDLFIAIDQSNKTNDKVQALVEFFTEAPPADCAWALSLLLGKKPRTPVRRSDLRLWCMEVSGVEGWLFDECYDQVGDFSETIALLVPDEESKEARGSLAEWMTERIGGLAGKPVELQKEIVLDSWSMLDAVGRFVYMKLLSATFRMGVSSELALRGAAGALGVPVAQVSEAVMGDWVPTAEFWESISSGERSSGGRPYPFSLAHPLAEAPESLGEASDYLVEYKWDGIRAQAIAREQGLFLWSRGEVTIAESFPDVVTSLSGLPPGTVLDGEIMAWEEGADAPLPFFQLQRRIGRKKPGKKLLEEVPCRLIAFDILEWEGKDVRGLPQRERRNLLEQVPGITVSPAWVFKKWSEVIELREFSREQRSEGLMLKHLDAAYEGSRKRGVWWKWKLEPFIVDAVLIRAQLGSGKRAGLYTDYTFALWDEDRLVPFAKAYSGLDDQEIRQVDGFIRNNITDRYGPVREVKPELVFELAFESIQPSTRHKAGLAVRFPRILRWRTDKKPEDADSLQALQQMVEHLAK